MNQIAVQPYYKVERKIERKNDGLEQQHWIDERMLILYQDRVTTHRREFAILDVFDMSYRTFSDGEGFFYLHTRKGVFSYMIREDPSLFIQAFKEYAKPRLHLK
ncbi:hypothetical protein [Paenibacillus nuruki]|uniref:hypothetical protein n=1 Tax=Paenibacillus nuruki TaxID=1886670 RepID=UPI0028041413|nr:hypothetical protein [Paenibacillus nuruki]CAJ1314120.1 HTH LytTR-type domain-containing protein [Paenibacillus nuruki]